MTRVISGIAAITLSSLMGCAGDNEGEVIRPTDDHALVTSDAGCLVRAHSTAVTIAAPTMEAGDRVFVRHARDPDGEILWVRAVKLGPGGTSAFLDIRGQLLRIGPVGPSADGSTTLALRGEDVTGHPETRRLVALADETKSRCGVVG